MGQMGFLLFVSNLICLLFLKPILLCQCQQQSPNTDGYFLNNFLQTMGSISSQNPSSGPVCFWEGVSCDSKNETVTGLVASGFHLSGLIPENSIGKLSNLQVLDLSNNEITGFSSDFWSLGSLKSLNLSYNLISGNLPTNIGNFGQLQTLDLSFNNFSGVIPQDISSLSNLQTLRLNQNGLESRIPSGLVICKSLVFFDLSSNRLAGMLPEEFLAAFPNLKSLNIADNMITGHDLDFSRLKSITYVNISRNQFQGSVVGLFQEPREIIDLSRNQFQGNISQVHNWSSLVYIDLSENKFTGEISASFGEAKDLKHLNLAYNLFYPREFPNINMLSLLEYLNLSRTSLVGHIPVEILKLDHLGTLDVSFNNLTGEIPLPVLEKVMWMKGFNFSYNNLTLCPSGISLSAFPSAFIGTTNICPIAVNPDKIREKSEHRAVLFLALALATLLGCLIAAVLIFVFGFGCGRKIGKQGESVHVEERDISGSFSIHTDSSTSFPVVIFEKPLLNLTFADLSFATSHFDQAGLLSESRYGPIYKGTLPGGHNIAVKVLVFGECDSILSVQEAGRELEILGRMRHPNLVSLIGYCLSSEKKIVVYDHMENGTLENLLHHRGEENLISGWSFRHKIALGVARALAFLHHGCSPPIIHRDVKASNIYLDLHLEPRLSESGLAKIFGNDDGLSSGYLSPEFNIQSGSGSASGSGSGSESLNPKFDVYGFGVVLLELVTGKKETGDLVRWIRDLVKKNEGSTAIDTRINGSASKNEMEEAIKIGYLCTSDLPWKRPSMQQVVGLLKDIQSD